MATSNAAKQVSSTRLRRMRRADLTDWEFIRFLLEAMSPFERYHSFMRECYGGSAARTLPGKKAAPPDFAADTLLD
jgi:hypothetical protein